MNIRARGTEQNAEKKRLKNRGVTLYAVTELAKGLNGPYVWAIAPTSFRLFGKWLIQPSNLCWSEWPPVTSSFMIAMVNTLIIITGSVTPWLPRMGKPVYASSMVLRTVRNAAVLTNL
jgi:hypothetical protein